MYRDAPKDWHIKSWPGKPIWTDIPLKLRKGWYKDIHHVFIDQHRYAMNKGVVLHKSDSVQMHWDRLWSRILADSQKKLQSLNGLGDRAIKKQSDMDIKKHNKDRDRRLGTDITNSNK
jgi:hypothetical protein